MRIIAVVDAEDPGRAEMDSFEFAHSLADPLQAMQFRRVMALMRIRALEIASSRKRLKNPVMAVLLVFLSCWSFALGHTEYAVAIALTLSFCAFYEAFWGCLEASGTFDITEAMLHPFVAVEDGDFVLVYERAEPIGSNPVQTLFAATNAPVDARLARRHRFAFAAEPRMLSRRAASARVAPSAPV